MPQQTVCPSCSEPLDPEDAYCGACGASRHAPAAAHAPVPGAMPSGWVAAPGRAAARTGTSTAPSAGTEDPPTLRVGHGHGPGLVAGADCAHCGAPRVTTDGYCEACGGAQPRPRDHMEKSLAGVAGVSDRGLRHHRNEDSFTVAATSLPGGAPAVVAVVCDGVSSSDRPDEASETAVDSACETLLTALERGDDPTAAMRAAIAEAARAVAALAEDDGPAGLDTNAPACTYVSAVATDGRVTIGWVGDTRAYWIPDDRACAEPFRLTQDDSWAARMVEAGLMGEAEAYADRRAHAITGWLGADAEEVVPHTLDFTPHVPGVLLVCTDGLWNYAEAATDLAQVVRPDARTEPLAAARALVTFAIEAGGHDNITVAVLPILPAVRLTGPGTRTTDDDAPHAATLPDLPVIGPPRTPHAPRPALPPLPPMPPMPPAAPTVPAPPDHPPAA